jgi:heavy metal sensor kinase
MSNMLRGLRSIRAKLALWYSLVLLSTLAAFGIIAYTYSSERLSENLDRSLRNEVKWVKNFLEPKAGKVKPSKKFSSKKLPLPDIKIESQPTDEDTQLNEADDEIWSQIYEHALLNPKKTLIDVTDKKGSIIFLSFSVGEESLMVADVPFDTLKIVTLQSGKGEDLRVAATATKNLHIYVAYPLAELSDVLDNLFSIFLVLVPIALAVSVGGGWFLANKSLKPVDEVTQAARQITAHKLDQRIPERDVDDEIGRLILTFNDMIVRLRHSFEQIKQFSVDASHELRTPLTIMRGEVELALRSTKEAEEYRRVLASNLEEILRLSSIIENLLTLSRADLGEQQVMLVDVDLGEIISELHQDGEILGLKKKIAIELSRNEAIVIKGDPLRLRQLFLNLLDNAIKYTAENGRVWLALERQNGTAKVTVRDNGVGIPKDDLTKIFDRFYRVDKARSRELGGNGLGLSIAKWVAELHKGRIEVESEVGHGSTFTVYLPA